MAGLAVERMEPVTACNIQTDESGDVRPGARSTGIGRAIVVPTFHGPGRAPWASPIAPSGPSRAEVQDLLAAGHRLADRSAAGPVGL